MFHVKHDPLEDVNECPLCAEADFSLHVQATDNLVSRETFNILKCGACGFLLTGPRPAEANAGTYYKSLEYVSHSDSSKGLINKLFKIARSYTLGMKVSLVRQLHPDAKSILDYGCGTGDFLSAAQKSGLTVTGIEPDADARAIAASKNNVVPLEPNVLANMPAAQFDLITLWHVLEHVYSLDETIKALSNLLKPDGKLVIAVPNAGSFDNRIYGAQWAAWDVPRHIYHFTPADIRRLMLRHGLSVTQIKPMPLDGFYIAMLSEKNKSNAFWFPVAIIKGMMGLIAAIYDRKKSSSLIYAVNRL